MSLKNQNGFSVVEGLLIFAIVGIIAGVGFFVYNSNKQASKTFDGAANTKLAVVGDKEASSQKGAENLPKIPSGQTSVKILRPVSTSNFGLFGNTAEGQQPVYPSSPSKIGNTVDANLYQGIVIVDNGTNRLLFGKLSDKALGVLQLDDAFEVINKELKVASPNPVSINTTTVIKWANLANDHRAVQAIRQFKLQNR